MARAADDPSGTLVVPRTRDLALVQADGSGERTLLSLGAGSFVSDAAWSPDGIRIAFSQYVARPSEPGGADIAVISASGGDPRVVVPRDQGGTLLGVPAWTPDGSELVFENVGYAAATGVVMRIETVAVDGTRRRTLVEGGRNPAISADGTAVAYLKSENIGDSVWVRPLAGGPERQVLADYELFAVAFPRFSPDGAHLAFAGVGTPDRGPALRPSSAERADTRAVPTGESTADRAHAMLGRHGLSWDLFVVDASGANLRRLALLTEDDAAVAWSPDGRWIAVSGLSGLRLVSVADGTVRQTSTIGSYGAIDWR